MSKQLIGIIIRGEGGYTPIIGYAVDMGDDDDGPIFDVIGKQPPQATEEEARTFILAESGIDVRYLTAVESAACSIGGIIWLKEVIRNQNPLPVL